MPIERSKSLMILWKRVLSTAYCWKCSIAINTFLWPPGIKQTAPKISKAAIFVLILSAASDWAMIFMLVGWANTCARPVYRKMKHKYFISMSMLDGIKYLPNCSSVPSGTRSNCCALDCWPHECQAHAKCPIVLAIRSIRRTEAQNCEPMYAELSSMHPKKPFAIQFWNYTRDSEIHRVLLAIATEEKTDVKCNSRDNWLVIWSTYSCNIFQSFNIVFWRWRHPWYCRSIGTVDWTFARTIDLPFLLWRQIEHCRFIWCRQVQFFHQFGKFHVQLFNGRHWLRWCERLQRKRTFDDANFWRFVILHKKRKKLEHKWFPSRKTMDDDKLIDLLWLTWVK